MTLSKKMLGHQLKGRTGLYTITKKLQDSVSGYNERDILRRFQHRSPYLRSLLDEVEHPPVHILRHLDDDLLHVPNSQRLTQTEVKYVAKGVLRALAVLHEEGVVHTDIKPINVLVDHGHDEHRSSDFQLANFGSTVHIDSSYARDGESIGTPIFGSPEAQLQMRWGSATDIWSFGTMLINLIYGEGFHIFKPNVPVDHDEYDLKIS